MNERDVDPSIRRLFPWLLFLVLAAMLSLGAIQLAHGAEPVPPKPKPSWSDWTCEKLRGYLATHTEAEARATAIEMHLPRWLVRKAEKCVP